MEALYFIAYFVVAFFFSAYLGTFLKSPLIGQNVLAVLVVYGAYTLLDVNLLTMLAILGVYFLSGIYYNTTQIGRLLRKTGDDRDFIPDDVKAQIEAKVDAEKENK